MRLNKRLSTTSFIISQIFILLIGLALLAGLYYILNFQYKKSDNPFLAGPVTSLPKTLKLDLDNPADNSLFFEDSILISGQTSPQKDVLIFTDSKNLVIKSKADGTFTSSLELDEGENVITVGVFEPNGDSKSVERTVFYSEEKI